MGAWRACQSQACSPAAAPCARAVDKTVAQVTLSSAADSWTPHPLCPPRERVTCQEVPVPRGGLSPSPRVEPGHRCETPGPAHAPVLGSQTAATRPPPRTNVSCREGRSGMFQSTAAGREGRESEAAEKTRVLGLTSAGVWPGRLSGPPEPQLGSWFMNHEAGFTQWPHQLLLEFTNWCIFHIIQQRVTRLLSASERGQLSGPALSAVTSISALTVLPLWTAGRALHPLTGPQWEAACLLLIARKNQNDQKGSSLLPQAHRAPWGSLVGQSERTATAQGCRRLSQAALPSHGLPPRCLWDHPERCELRPSSQTHPCATQGSLQKWLCRETLRPPSALAFAEVTLAAPYCVPGRSGHLPPAPASATSVVPTDQCPPCSDSPNVSGNVTPRGTSRFPASGASRPPVSTDIEQLQHQEGGGCRRGGTPPMAVTGWRLRVMGEKGRGHQRGPASQRQLRWGCDVSTSFNLHCGSFRQVGRGVRSMLIPSTPQPVYPNRRALDGKEGRWGKWTGMWTPHTGPRRPGSHRHLDGRAASLVMHRSFQDGERALEPQTGPSVPESQRQPGMQALGRRKDCFWG